MQGNSDLIPVSQYSIFDALNFRSEVERKDKTSHMRNIIVTTGTKPPTIYPNQRKTTPTKLFESTNLEPIHGETNAMCEKELRYENGKYVNINGGHLRASSMEPAPGANELCPKHSAIVGAARENGYKVKWFICSFDHY